MCCSGGELARRRSSSSGPQALNLGAQARHEQPSSGSSPMDTRGARGELVRALGKPNHCMPLKYHAKPDPKSRGSSEVQLNQVKSNQTVRNKIAPSYLDAAVPAAHPRSGRQTPRRPRRLGCAGPPVRGRQALLRARLARDSVHGGESFTRWIVHAAGMKAGEQVRQVEAETHGFVYSSPAACAIISDLG